MGMDKLKETLKAPDHEVHSLYESILEQLSALFDFRDVCEKDCESSGQIRTIFGRMRRLKSARNAANSIVQGSAADIAKQAMVRVKKALAEQAIKAHLFLHMHDELIYETAECNLALVAQIVKTEMEAAGDGLRVRLPVKVRVGPDWGHLEEYH